MNKRWKNRPRGSTWGDWGENDQLGRLNLVSPEQVLKGIAEVKVGLTFCLSLPLHLPGGSLLSPVRKPPRLCPVERNETDYYNYEWRNHEGHSECLDIASDDLVTLYTQYSTQWDSLAHRGALFDVNGNGESEPVYYNGYRAGEDVVLDKESKTTAAKKLGIENMAAHGVQGRGVMVDLRSHCGEFPRKKVGYDKLMGIMEQGGVEVEAGDIVCFWTGFDNMILRNEGKPDDSLKNACAVLDGRDKRLLKWIADTEIAAIASDNLAVEAVGEELPKDHGGMILPLHELCLFRLGVHLGELWLLADLAKWLKENNRSRFLLTAPPLRLTGAVGSPVTPIATV